MTQTNILEKYIHVLQIFLKVYNMNDRGGISQSALKTKMKVLVI